MLQTIIDILKGAFVDKVAEVYAEKIIAAASAEEAEDVVSEHATAATPWIFDMKSNSGSIEKAIVAIQTTALTPRLTLYLLNRWPSCALGDDVANTCPILADLPYYVGSINFPATEDLGTATSNAIATASTYGNLPLPYYTSDKKLYGVLVTRDAVTITAADRLTIKLQIRRD
jgi:hypothetical protein